MSIHLLRKPFEDLIAIVYDALLLILLDVNTMRQKVSTQAFYYKIYYYVAWYSEVRCEVEHMIPCQTFHTRLGARALKHRD